MSGLVGIAVMFYLEWHGLSLTLSHGNSRLLALQARIRPHFLFNSLNSAIASVRGDPRLAERILLDMADLFRSVLSDESAVVRMERELEVAKSYIEIEQLRLGDRLEVDWAVAQESLQLKVPALILQPLLENAVYHGIERLEAGGRITTQIAIQGDRLVIIVENPVSMADTPFRAGSGMALDNIRERIALQYDGDARMEARREGGRFLVSIMLPLCTS